MQQLSRLARTPRAQILGLCALVALVLFWLGLDEPLHRDHAYFVHLGQSIVDGRPIYHHTFYRYPPTGPLVTAASMQVGRLLDVPTYLAPRFAGMGILLACVLLAWQVVRRATGSGWAGVLAGVAMASFSHFTTLCATDVEPKILIALFTLGGAAAVQRGSALGAGLASGLAGTCWQPAALLALALLAATAWNGRRRLPRSLARYAVGTALGALPAVLYLLATDGVGDFWQRGIVQPASAQLAGSTRPDWWLLVLWVFYANERVLFVAAGAGFLLFALASLRPLVQGPRGLGAFAGHWLGARMGALPVVTPAWLVFNSSDFQSFPDLLPFIAVVAFWVGWAGERVLGALAPWPRLRAGAAAALLAAAAVYGLGDAWLHEPAVTLEAQVAAVGEIVRPAGEDGAVVAFDAPEVYALTGRASPFRFVTLNASYAPFATVVNPDGCRGILRDLLGLGPAVVVILDHPGQSGCVRAAVPLLLRERYVQRRISFPWRQHTSYHPADAEPARLDWLVFTRVPGS